jgi:methionine sulfoxide reductase heme-binding subunit
MQNQMQNQKTQDYTWPEIMIFALGSVIGAIAGLWAINHLVAAMAAQAPGFWFVSRAAGIAAFILLWLSTAWGVSLSSKGIGGLISAPLAYALHNVMSWLALGFSLVHALALLGDQVVPFTLGGILIPFRADYQTIVTGLGTLSLYIGILVSVTFYWKKRIGYRAWRMIHMLSYGMFVAIVVHSIILGTDTKTVAMQAMYIVAGGSVLFLTLFRIFTARGQRRPAVQGAQAG